MDIASREHTAAHIWQLVHSLIADISLMFILEEYVKIDSRFEQLQTQYNTFINETLDFFDWYLSQNDFKKISWNIRKLNYKQLKQIKDNNGSI